MMKESPIKKITLFVCMIFLLAAGSACATADKEPSAGSVSAAAEKEKADTALKSRWWSTIHEQVMPGW